MHSYSQTESPKQTQGEDGLCNLQVSFDAHRLPVYTYVTCTLELTLHKDSED